MRTPWRLLVSYPIGRAFPDLLGVVAPAHLRDFNESRERAARLYREVRHRGDRGLLLQAHHCSWAALHNQGDLAGSARHIRAGLALYRVDEHRGHASFYGNHDAKVCAHAYLALGLWQRGLARAAEAEEAQSLAWAQSLDMSAVYCTRSNLPSFIGPIDTTFRKCVQ